MRPCIYFQPKPELDNFEGTRLRKNLKGALELENVSYAKNIIDEYDLIHFLSLNDELKIDEAVNNNIPVVYSAMYAEQDPVARTLSGFKNKETLSLRAQRILNKCDLVFVPTLEDKLYLEDNGVTTHMEVLTPGVNLSRFRMTGMPEDDVFFDYYQIEKDSKCVVSIGDLGNKETIEKLFEIARLLPNYKFFYLGPGKHIWHLFRARKIPKNVILSSLVNDEVYCSMLKNAKYYLILSEANTPLLTLLEVMASKTEIVMLDEVQNNKEILLKEKRAHACVNVNDIADTIKRIEDGELESTIDAALKYAKANSLAKLGPALINQYQKLLEEKKND